MSDSYNQLKTTFRRRLLLGGVILLVVFIAASVFAPGALTAIVVFAIVAALIGVVILSAMRMGGGVLAGRRAEAQRQAEAEGYTFEPLVGVSEGAEFLQGINDFELFLDKQGVLGKRPDAETDLKAARVMDSLGTLDVTNRITGVRGGHAFQAFDFRFSRFTQSQGAQRTTVFLLQLPGARLPSFRMIPRASAGRVGSFFARIGGNEVELSAHPDFSRLYILRASDRPAVESLFSSGLASDLERLAIDLEDVSVEAAGDRFLLYRFGQLAEGDRFAASLAAATRVADSLACGSPPPG